MLLEFLTERNGYIPENSLSDVLHTSPVRNEFTEFLRVNLKWGILSPGIPASHIHERLPRLPFGIPNP